MSDNAMLDLIISMIPHIKPADRISLLKAFDREEDFIVMSKRDIEKILNTKIITDYDIDAVRAKAEKIASVCMKRSIFWVSWNDGMYPPLLREIFDPPCVIFCRGKLPNPDKPLLGMVGTRKPSPESSAQAFAIARDAALAGISVVSGLALGIDSMSHRGNLKGSVPGYAVLGSGVDEVYPSSNRMLAKLILESGGALLSEYPPGTLPAKWHFPARNRIISGLSRSVIIVEAPEKSGALITAAFALDQGRDLWVASSGIKEIPSGSLKKKLGTIKLASDGADVIYSARDVLDKWNMEINDNNKNASWNEDKSKMISSMADSLGIKL